jgi:cytochrome c6
VLKKVDFGLELVGWTLALAFVILLFAGPHVIAEDKAPKPDANTAGAAPGAGQAGGGGAEAGKAVFTGTCGSCHTLSAAGTSGSVGPNLDDTSLDAAAIEEVVRGGRGTMPSFDGKLSDAEIKSVAAFVAGN